MCSKPNNSIKFRTILSMFIAALTLAGGTFADPTGTYASGLLHLPLGNVQDLTVDGRRLTACCLGSSGQDGVEVVFGSLWGGGVGVDLTPLLVNPASEIQCLSKGWDGTVKGHLRIEGYGDGSITSIVDFSAAGAVGVRTMTYSADGHLVSDILSGGPILAIPEVPECPPPGVPTWWQTSWGGWIWGCAYGQDPHGNPYPYLRVITPVFPPGVPDISGVGSVEITGTNLGELNLIDANLGTFGASSWALGQAHLSEQCHNPGGCSQDQVVLVADNLGISGMDGIAIDLGDNLGGTELHKGNCCRGHVIIMKAFDDENQEIMRVQTATDPNPSVEGQTFSIDFSPGGAIALDVEFLDEYGQTLRRYPVGGLPFGGWMSGMCPPGCSEIWIQDWYSGSWTFVRCDCLSWYDFVLDSGEVVPNVHSIVFRPVGAGNLVPRRLEITTDDPSGAITIETLTLEPRCVGNLNGDNQIGIADLAALLANYGTASGALPKDGDLDGDGDVDLADLAALLSVYGTTCP